MTVLGWRSVVLVAIYGLSFKVNHITAAECDLEKIFRTPKDMSKVNFDHFEIVERTGFDRTGPTTFSTTTESPHAATTTKKNGPNIANAQVLVRFGGDDMHGSNHIMKIPPQCRHFAGNSLGHPTDLYYPPSPHRYPPPCSPHYYHPYPPPVPYVFPNYYFCNNGHEPQYLPPQLREYFRRHPEFLSEEIPSRRREVFIRGRPVRREEMDNHADFVEGRKPPIKNIENLNIAPPNKLKMLPEVIIIHPRILKSLELSNEDIEKAIVEKTETKRECASVEKNSKENVTAVKEKTRDKNDISASLEENPKVHDKNYKDDKKKVMKSKESVKHSAEDIAMLLNKALVAYKCQNCTGPPKMLISYPISNTQEDETASDQKPILLPSSCPFCNKSKHVKFSNDVDGLSSLNTHNIRDSCKCRDCQCNKKVDIDLIGKKFKHDLDDLIAIVVAQIPDPVGDFPKTSTIRPPRDEFHFLYPKVTPPVIPIPKLAQLSLDLDDALRTTLDLDMRDYGYSSTRKSFPKVSHSQYSVSSVAGYRSNPETMVLYQAPTEIKTYDLEENLPIAKPKIEYKQNTYISARKCSVPRENPSPKYLKVIPYEPDSESTEFYQAPIGVKEDLPKIEYRRYALPDTSISARKIVVSEESPLPKYLKVINREPVPTIISPEFEDVPRRNYLPERYLPTKPTAPTSFDDLPYSRQSRHSTGIPSYYFFPEPNVSIRRPVERQEPPLPRYFKVVPREDLEIVPPSESGPKVSVVREVLEPKVNQLSRPAAHYCRRCGHNHGGGNFCVHCGLPVTMYPPPTGSPYCANCPKETRQLNDW